MAQNADLQLFPNPAGEYLNVVFELPVGAVSSKSARLEVYDITGRLLLQKAIISENGNLQAKLDVSAFSTGTYFLRLESGAVLGMGRFVKQ